MADTTNNITLTDTEKRVLQNLHLKGYTGPMGNMKLAQRRKLMCGLVDRGFLDKNGVPTKLGIEVSAPFYNQHDNI